jgi:hypothetical protein
MRLIEKQPKEIIACSEISWNSSLHEPALHFSLAESIFKDVRQLLDFRHQKIIF